VIQTLSFLGKLCILCKQLKLDIKKSVGPDGFSAKFLK